MAHLQSLTPEAFMRYRGGESAGRGNISTSLQSLCTLQTAQICLMTLCKAVTTWHRETTAHSCAALLTSPERPRGGTRRRKSGLRNCTLTLCRWEATPRGLSAADIFRIICMLLQSSPGSKSKIQKCHQLPAGASPSLLRMIAVKWGLLP